MLRLGNRTNNGISINTPTQAWETMQNRRVDVIRELMAENEGNPMQLGIPQQMLETAQNAPRDGGIQNVRYAPRPGGLDASV